MNKCPKCEAEIDHLVNFYLHWTEATFRLEGERPVRDYNNICMSDSLKDEYNCPACDSLLFTKESKAVAFLKGGPGEKGDKTQILGTQRSS